MTTNAETLSRLEAANLDIPEEPVECGICGESIDDCWCDDDSDSWELAVREERERLE